MDIQSIFVDGGIAALLVIQVLKLVNGWLKRSKTVDQIGDFIEGRIESVSRVSNIGIAALDALEDREISPEEFEAFTSLVREIHSRKRQESAKP